MSFSERVLSPSLYITKTGNPPRTVAVSTLVTDALPLFPSLCLASANPLLSFQLRLCVHVNFVIFNPAFLGLYSE